MQFFPERILEAIPYFLRGMGEILGVMAGIILAVYLLKKIS